MSYSYEEAVRHSTHDYGEYIKSINFVEEAIESTQSKYVYEKTKELLINEYEEEIEGGRKRRKIKQKAKQAANPRLKGPYNFLEKFSGRSGSERLVKEAIEKGYIRNVKLSVPWHPAIYEDETKLTTFPHQHKSAVVYTNRSRKELYTREYLKRIEYHKKVDNSFESIEELFNPDSILKMGFIAPANKEQGEEEKSLTERRAIFFSAGNYADTWRNTNNFIFECELPTNNLGFSAANGEDREGIWSIEGWFDSYENPEDKIRKNQAIFANKYSKKRLSSYAFEVC